MKKKIRKAICTMYFMVFVGIYCTNRANAYLDPATTAMLAQIVGGFFITLGVMFGLFRRRIFLLIKNLRVKRLQRKIEKQSKEASS